MNSQALITNFSISLIHCHGSVISTLQLEGVIDIVHGLGKSTCVQP